MEINKELISLTHTKTTAQQAELLKDNAQIFNADKIEGLQTEQPSTPILPASPVENLADALKLLGFAATRENMGFAAALIQNGLPVNADNLRQLNRAVKLMGDERAAVFLLNNGIKVSTPNAEQLKAFVTREFSLTGELSSIANELEQMPEGSLKEALIKVFLADNAETETPQLAAAADVQQAAPQTDSTQVIKPQSNAPEVVAPLMEPPQTNQSDNSTAETTQPRTDATKPDTPVNPSQEMLTTDTPVNGEQTKQTPVQTVQANPPPEQRQPEMSEAAQSLEHNNTDDERMLSTQQEARTGSLEAKTETAVRAVFVDKEVLTEKTAAAVRKDTQEEVREDKQGEAHAEKPENNKKPLLARLLSKYAANPEKDSREEALQRLGRLREALSEAKSLLTVHDGPLRERADKLGRAMDFMTATQRIAYTQFLFVTPTGEQNADLYVFRDKKKTTSKSNSHSALLSLDFAYLGHFEAYIQRVGQSVSIQFRTEETARRSVSSTIAKLSEMLLNKGFRLDAYTFAENAQPFNLLDKEPVGDSSGTAKQSAGDIPVNLNIEA